MTHYKAVAPGENIGAVEFGGIGKTRTVTMGKPGAGKAANQLGVENTVFRVPIGGDRFWIVNGGNQQCLAAMFGTEVENWVGKRVTLVSEASDKSPTGQAIRVAGSPDLKADIEATIRLQGKLVKKTLKRTVES